MITCIFGLPGCGKSTLLAKIAARELRRIAKGKSKYNAVYCNYYIKGCKILNFGDLGTYDTSGGLILLDEITLDADSRNFKNFKDNSKSFFILHRKYGCDVIYVTQQYDAVDKKIRELTSDLYYMKKNGPITYATRIYRHISITMDGDIKMGYRFPTFAELIRHPRYNIMFCFRRCWYKYFDSFEAPPLPPKEWKEYG